MKRAILPLILMLCLSFTAFSQEASPYGRHVYMAKKFKKTNKVVFSKFIVTFSTAASQNGPLDKEHARYGTFLEGVDPSELQTITNDLFADFKAQLTELGYEVLDNSAVINSKSMASWKLEDDNGKPWLADLPYDLQQFGDREVAICFAHGSPDYRHADLTRLPGKNGKFEDLSNETDAIVISAGFHVYFMKYNEKDLGKSKVAPASPELYLASNMQTRLNTQITFHYWNEKELKEPIMATYWVDRPIVSVAEIGTLAANKEAKNGGELSPPGTTAVANNYVKANKEMFSKAAKDLLHPFSKMAIDDWQNSIHDK